ncbi:5-amino-6-(D-ribitylamino)uracil--L-tyrosine 4-hydroxyphenyl transferase CofH [Methanoregula formicica]|uniref:5-amino-6-(D-ribitylamino)uracil--L-tyrosine 4-hydroxyphenyl transferase n=1 Tax=Methanoregula formicica (strain DSM 22288 / NBRC 105244 / SMSP) TaxID=593750 RepID=L0HBP7_METFS|nr:5-amino-6-(D-ribitylamino)uracil--L-tyrosine 4-hydroxyphenyl transferase CofH [Methanoregula formicica]AGB01221.1 radical SAM domain protein, CofH subfamily [Methanoregula formicica SMSP]
MTEIQALLSDVMEGHRLTEQEAEQLLKTTGRDVWRITAAADEMRERRAGEVVTYVRNQNLHVTNICKNLCRFCGFGRKATDEGAYCHDKAAIQEQARLAKERGVTEICFLSGVHPGFTLDTYCEMMDWVHEAFPGVHIHAFSPDEVAYAAKRGKIPTPEVIERLKEGGLGTIQGTAAEILVDSVREVICPRKVPTADWVRIIKEAHRAGMRSTATIMYGSYESPRDQAEHLRLLREVQDDTHGFTELVTLPFVHTNTPLWQQGLARAGPTGREDLLMIAVSRLFLDNFTNVQVAWGKVGLKMTQLALISGANDLAGTMFTDDVTGDAGGAGSDYLDPKDMERIASDLGRKLQQRTTLYELL